MCEAFELLAETVTFLHCSLVTTTRAPVFACLCVTTNANHLTCTCSTPQLLVVCQRVYYYIINEDSSHLFNPFTIYLHELLLTNYYYLHNVGYIGHIFVPQHSYLFFLNCLIFNKHNVCKIQRECRKINNYTNKTKIS